MVAASVEAMTGYPEMFVRMFQEVSDPLRTAPMRRAVSFFEAHGFDWNDHYLTTATPGRTYSGIFVGKDQDNFMLPSGAQIVIGSYADLEEPPVQGRPVTVMARTEVT